MHGSLFVALHTRECPWCKKEKSIQFDYSAKGKQCRECLAKYRKKYATAYGIKSAKGWSSMPIVHR
jgi:glutaredoxin